MWPFNRNKHNHIWEEDIVRTKYLPVKAWKTRYCECGAQEVWYEGDWVSYSYFLAVYQYEGKY